MMPPPEFLTNQEQRALDRMIEADIEWAQEQLHEILETIDEACNQ